MDNYRLCRICISQFESPIMMSIFGENALWKKITSFANVHIEEGDNLPQQICIVCANNAINACSFKQKCEEADSFYRKQLLRRMELKLPEDTEIISISSGFFNMKNTNNEEEKNFINTSDRRNSVDSINELDQNEENSFVDNFPTLIDETAGLSGEDQTEWDNCAEQESESDDKFDDSLPLIPEIELITPNDEDLSREGDDNSKYECNICFKYFAMKSLLRHHMKTCHPETNPYQCCECKKSYLSKRFLEKHIRLGRCIKKRKNTTRPMQCSECKKVFPSGHHLGWHKRTGSCRSRSPKLSLTAYEKNDSEATDEQDNSGFGNLLSSRRDRRRKFGKLKQKGGRTRIRLDSKKIAYATELVKKEVSTTKFAQELNISRTFAWRLRKTIENNLYKEGKLEELKNKSKPTIPAAAISVITKNIIPNNIQHIEEANKNINNLFLKESEFNCMNNKDFQAKALLQRSNDLTNILNTQGSNLTDQMNSSIIENNMLIENNKKNEISPYHKDTVKIKQEIDDSKDEKQNVNDARKDSLKNESNTEIQMKDSHTKYLQPGCSLSFNDKNKENNIKEKIKALNDSINAHKKKPRKPNVFIDEVKYAQAKILVSNNASTMEIAKKLDVSQMSAWKLRDCILKNIPLKLKKSSFIESDSHIASFKKNKIKPKNKVPRQRLRRDERVQRDKMIAKEILKMINEDHNIQYWKVSEKLAEKGYSVSSSSVCQRLKSMGIHRRTRQIEQNQSDKEHSTQSNQGYNSNTGNENDDDDTDSSSNCEQQQNLSTEPAGINLEDHSHFLKTHFNNLA